MSAVTTRKVSFPLVAWNPLTLCTGGAPAVFEIVAVGDTGWVGLIGTPWSAVVVAPVIVAVAPGGRLRSLPRTQPYWSASPYDTLTHSPCVCTVVSVMSVVTVSIEA